jgi:hypothetical protein
MRMTFKVAEVNGRAQGKHASSRFFCVNAETGAKQLLISRLQSQVSPAGEVHLQRLS